MIQVKEIEEIVRRFDKIKSDRTTWDSHFEEILTYCLPRKKGVISSVTPGQKFMKKILDGTAIWGSETCAAGLNTWLTSSVNKWFELRTKIKELMDYDEVKEWFQEVENIMYGVFNSSNFSTAIHESYLDDVTIGTSIIYIEEDEEDVCRYSTRHISECYILENNKQRVDTLFRKWEWTLRQAYQEWGEKIGASLMKKYKKKPDDKAEFLHVVRPRGERNPFSSTKENLPYESLWIYPKEKHLIDEGGYNEMPFMCSRWLKGSQQTYGYSPAMNALSHVSMLQEMKKTLLMAGQKMVSPTTWLPHDGVVGTVRDVPGGINYLNSEYFKQGKFPIRVRPEGNIPLGLELNQDERDQILKFFFVDLFLLLQERPQMTATEVYERVDEKMTLIGPTLGRMMVEKLDPTVFRTFGICGRAGYFPPTPEVLVDQQFEIEYVSPLARVQKLFQAKAVRKTMVDAGPYFELFPEMADNVDPDGLWDVISDSHGFPETASRTKVMKREVRQVRQQATEQEMQKEDAVQVVDTLATAKKAGLLDEQSQKIPIT